MLGVIAFFGMAGWFVIGGVASGDQLLLGVGLGLGIAGLIEAARALERGEG